MLYGVFAGELRWTAGLFVSLAFGGIITQYYARRVRKLIGDQYPQYRVLIPIPIVLVENLFFAIVVVFEIQQFQS